MLIKLLILDYLKIHSLIDLEKEHGIYASISNYGHKVSLNYDQIESKESDKLACQCRGIIVAKNDNSTIIKDQIFGDAIIISYGMDRFFNYGQKEVIINFNDPKLRIMSKLDGTCIMVYKDPFLKDWCVATRNVSDANVPLDNGKFTFRTLFEKCLFDMFSSSFEEFTSTLDENLTYVFELTSFYNRLVVEYKENKITLLAARNLKTLKEVDIKSINISIPKVEEYFFASINDIFKWVNEQKPSEHEGVVIMDSNFNRVKVKSIAYVMCNRANNSFGTSDRDYLKLILLSKEDDVALFFNKEIMDNILSLKERVKIMLNKHEQLFFELKQKSNYKKEFAQLLLSNNKVWTAPLFNMYDNKCKSIMEFINSNKTNNIWSNSFLDKILDII